jgi:hypothetical protein
LNAKQTKNKQKTKKPMANGVGNTCHDMDKEQTESCFHIAYFFQVAQTFVFFAVN